MSSFQFLYNPFFACGMCYDTGGGDYEYCCVFSTGLKENEDFVSVIKSVRAVCDDFSTNTDVSAYPNGYPFTFWQQYIDLRYWLFVSLASVVGAIFFVIAAVLVNPYTAFITVS